MASEAVQDWDLISSYAGLLTLATFSIYAGAHGSLKLLKKVKEDKDTTEDDEDEEEEDIPDRLSAADAYLFPVLGSIVLFGMYLIVKFLGKEWINKILGWYFTFAGIGSVWKCSTSLAKWAYGQERWKTFSRWKLRLSKGSEEVVYLAFRTPSLILLIPSLVPSVLYYVLPGSKRSALLTDILALSFSHSALSIMKLDQFKTGVILLSGLFLYDIWWVFGTDVMVKVATSLDVPIKILWPKSLLFSTERGLTMLGLGDIVIPGMFVSTALRYDLSRSEHKDPKKPFSQPYFTAAAAAYVLGLATTMAVMHIFGAAQPALLYLSPACILSFFITSLARGEFKEAWEWTDEPEPSEGREGIKQAEVNAQVPEMAPGKDTSTQPEPASTDYADGVAQQTKDGAGNVK